MVVSDVTSVLKSRMENGSARLICNTCAVSLVLLQNLYVRLQCKTNVVHCSVYLMLVQAQHALLCNIIHATESVQLAHALLD